MTTKHFWSRFNHTAELPLRLMVVVSMLIGALMLPMGTASAESSNRVMCENDPNLVGCWRMEEGSGTSLQDGGATPFNDGTLNNSPTWVAGKYGQGLGFNGSNQYVLVPDENSLDITSAITLAAWVKPGKTGTQNIIKKAIGTGAPGGYELSLSNGGIVFIRLNGGTTTTTRLDSSITYPTNGTTWMHIAATTNGTFIKVYINGTLDTSKTVTPFIINTNATNIGIGAEPAATPINFFQGVIDDARIYNRALTDPEIAALASTTPPGDTTAPAAPTGLAAVPGDTTVALTWDALTLPHDVKGWNVYRSETSPVDTGTPLDYVTTESYSDNSVSNGTLYYYTVKAVDTSDNLSDPASEASATPFGNEAPVVTGIPDQTITEGESFTTITLDDYVSDADNTPAEMNWTYSGTTDLSVSIVDRVATITLPDADWNGSEMITFRATDPGFLYGEDTATFTVNGVNDAPVCVDVILSTPEDTPGETAPSCTDPDPLDTLTYTIVDQGTDGDASVVTGNLHYAPDLDFVGGDAFTYKANDTHVDSNTANVAVTVTAVDDPPMVTDPGAQSSAEGDVISLQIAATDGDSPTLAYSALNLPEGLGIDPASGLISGTISFHAAANSPYSASVTVTDGTTPVSVYFTWTVTQTAFGACDGETGLVGCWELEEGSGSIIYDGSPAGNDGTTTGGPGWVAGIMGDYALSLNGTTQSASVPDDDSLDLTDAFTIAGWIKPEKSDTQDLFKKADMGLTNGYEVGLATTTKVLFRINQVASSNTYRIDSTTLYPIDGITWMHVAATYSGGTMKLFINGVQEGGDKAAPAPEVNILPFTLGTQVTAPRYYQGAMDDVRLYDRALSEDEIRLLAGLNVAPVVSDIPGQVIDEGDSFTTINLDDFVSDANHTDAEMTWSYSGNTDLSVFIDEVSHVATISTPDVDWNGSEVITFTATDPGLLFDEDDATFTVTAVNDAPVVTGIPDQTILEGASFATIYLDSYVSDVDDSDESLIWSYSGNTDLTVNIVDRVATITIPDADWNGSETITFKASDPDELWDDDDAIFAVTGVNDAPVVSDIPDQTVAEGASFTTINLDDYVFDIDDSDEDLDWSFSGNTDLTINIVEQVATITIPDADWNGFETITFTATDPDDLFDEDDATFTVTAVNDAPVVTGIPDQTILEGASFATIYLDSYVSDVDDSDESLIWSYSGNTDLIVNIVDRVATITPPDANWYGSETITFKASDLDELWDDDTATFTVTGVNDGPVVSDIPDQTIAEGASFTTIDLDDYVADIDNTDAEIIWTYTGTTDLLVNIVDRVATITTPDADWNGSEMITFRATDPGTLFAEDDASLTVSPVNDAPVVTGIPDQAIAEGASFATIDLDDYVSDVDDIDMELTWSYSGNTDLTVNIVARVATITIPDTDWNGSETITFKATDPGMLFGEDDAAFTVTGVNDGPVLDPIGSKSTDELVPLLFTATATDIDLPANALTYSLADGSSGSVPEGADIDPSSGDFSWTPTEAQGPDTFTFDVCVSDGLASDCETISVTVSEVATSPTAVADAYDVILNSTLLVSAPGVLANDSDTDIPANTLTAILDTGTMHGLLVLNPDGSFTYTPEAMWSGIDTFSYRVYDGTSYSEVVTVTITVKLMEFYLPMILN